MYLSGSILVSRIFYFFRGRDGVNLFSNTVSNAPSSRILSYSRIRRIRLVSFSGVSEHARLCDGFGAWLAGRVEGDGRRDWVADF
jgi:hypothetical protein